MKKVILLVAIILSLFSCKKDKKPTPAKTYDIKGLYTGTYTVTNQPNTTYPITIIFEENNLVTVVSNAENFSGASTSFISYGTYSLSGSNVTIAVSRSNGQNISYTATFDNATGKLSGNWNSPIGGGTTLIGNFTSNKDISGKESITGYWKGTYTFGSSQYSYIFIIEKNGKCVAIANGSVANAGIQTAYGSYSLTGTNSTVFSTTIRYSHGTGTQNTLIADWNKTEGKLSGTWGSGTVNTGGGTWTLTKMYY